MAAPAASSASASLKRHAPTGGRDSATPPIDASPLSAAAPPPSVLPHARPTLHDVLARLAENGFARECVRCVRICKDAAANAQLWERVVDLQHADPAAGGGAGYAATRLVHWVRRGDAARVRGTLDRGASVSGIDSSGHSALWYATWRGDVSIVRELLGRGATIDAVTGGGWTMLMQAAYGGHTAIVSELAARGAAVDARDGVGWTPLARACRWRRADSAQPARPAQHRAARTGRECRR